MARARVTVTQSWTQIAVGRAIFTVAKAGRGPLYFNETPNDTTANVVNPGPERQFQQGDDLPTYVRSDGLGYELIADGAL
jgi:hypothetical protein